MESIQATGTWRGVLFIDKMKEYIEDEIFQIEIQSIDAQNLITATVKEQIQEENLCLHHRDRFTVYDAEGKLDAHSGEFQLHYKAGSLHGGPVTVELSGTIDKNKETIEGQYRTTSRQQWQASFLLKKTKTEPL